MDTIAAPEDELLRQVAENLRPHGVRMVPQARRPGADRGDVVLTLQVGGRRLRYAATLMRGLRPAVLGTAVHQLRRQPGRTLLIADHVTPPLADRLRAEGVEFADAAGNVFIDQPPVLVFVKGQRPTALPAAAEAGRAFRATGLQVLFVLLARPEIAAAPYRTIATAAGVAHGAVGWVMAELPRLGFLAEVAGRRRLVNAERLLDLWTQAFATTLRPKLLLGRYRGEVATLADVARADLAIGGEMAAARLTRHLRPATATFYAPVILPEGILALRLRQDPQGNVEFRRKFWTIDADVPGLVPTLLVYADLLAIGDARCLEAAQMLRGPLVDRPL